MSSGELARMGKLRQVLRLASQGKGIAASIVETFRGSRAAGESEMVRRILLGNPVDVAVKEVISGSDRTREILLYVVNQAKVDAVEASKRADRLTTLFEHWVWMKQQRVVEQKIMETRSIMVSAILGGVTAMISALAPVLASFQLTLGTQPPPATPSYLGALFVVPAAAFLGFFFSPRRAYINLVVAAAAYGLVAYYFTPLVVAI